MFTIDTVKIPQNDWLYKTTTTKKNMLLQNAIAHDQQSRPTDLTTVNNKFLPLIHKISGEFFILKQDSDQVHRAAQGAWKNQPS